MGQQSAGTSEVRETEDDSGPKRHSQKQEGFRQASRHGKVKPSPASRFQAKRLETDTSGKVGETLLWEWKCDALGFQNWARRFGPAEGFIMAKLIAEAIDHDEARVMAFGGKKYELELRVSGRNGKPRKFEIGGYPIYKYTAYEVRKPVAA